MAAVGARSAVLGRHVAAADDDELTWVITPSSDSLRKQGPIRLKEGESTVLGRTKQGGKSVVVALDCVSGKHAELEVEDRRLFVTDLGSSNGTYANGRRVRNRTRLRTGSELRLGNENFDGAEYASFDVDLEGANEFRADTEYGQLEYFFEFVGGYKNVLAFVVINIFFQLAVYALVAQL